MPILNLREQRRKETANLEKERMICRYDVECGTPTTRKASIEEMNKIGRKTNEKEHIKFLKNSIGYY